MSYFEYLTIDPNTRRVTVPVVEQTFGVQNDTQAVRKYFKCARYVGAGLDLAGMFLRVNFRNANGEVDAYLVDDVAVSGDEVTFSWLLSKKVTAYQGQISFVVCAVSGRGLPEWNTTLATGNVLQGLEPDSAAVEAETADVIAQLLAMVTAQTGNVEAAGADQVKAVQAAAAVSTQEARDQIQAKGEATLATIPEDYTAMAGKVNEFANAIKGHLSGEIVRADDVSPVEHYLGVKVHGKNLFNADRIKPTGPFNNYAYITAAGGGAVTIYSNATDDGYCATGLTLRDICPGIAVGKVYTLNGTTEAEGRPWMYFLGANVTVVYGRSFTVTEELLGSNVVLSGINGKESGAGSCTISNIQIEEGTVATEYTPYIDPTGVIVTRYGADETDNTETFTPLEDGAVTGLTSLAPTMTLLSDTPGVVIDCTYNRDTNVVLAEILERITALGG